MANHGSCDSEGKCCRLLAAEGGKNGRVSHVELHEAADGSLTPSTSSCSLSDDASESSISTAPRPRAADQEERPLLEEERIEIGLDEVIEISDDDEIIEISDDDEALETSERRKRPRSRSPLRLRRQNCLVRFDGESSSASSPPELCRDRTSVEDFLHPFKKLCIAVDSMCL